MLGRPNRTVEGVTTPDQQPTAPWGVTTLGQHQPHRGGLGARPPETMASGQGPSFSWAHLSHRERMTGIEPAFSAWEADVLPLNYIRRVQPSLHGGRSLGWAGVVE